MKKRIITISREFGSVGHSIGKIVAETLGIRFYDQELLEKIAEETGFSKEFIVEAAEYSTAKNSLLFNLVMNRSLHGRMEPSPADTIYFAQIKTNGEKSTIHTTQTVRGAYRRITIYALTVTHWVKKYV